MAYGQVAHPSRLFALAALLVLFLAVWPLACYARRPASATVSVTLISVSDRRVQAQDEAGRMLGLAVTPASWFLRRGLRVSAGDFTPGEAVVLRQRAGAGGRAQVALLCDPESDAVMERYRRRPVVGTVVSQSARAWVVLPSDSPDGVPLTLPVSAQTKYRVGGAACGASAFGPGANVTVTTHGLPDGPLAAVSVSEAADAPAPGGEETRRAAFVSGTVLDVQPDAGVLTVQDKTGASQTVGVDGRTRVKVRRQPGTLADIAAGMRVSVRLGADVDAAGNAVAASVSALDPAPARKKR